MNYRRLGSAGLKVSELSFGSWVSFGTQMDVDAAYDCMVAAYDGGRQFFFDNRSVCVVNLVTGGRNFAAPAGAVQAILFRPSFIGVERRAADERNDYQSQVSSMQAITFAC